MWPIVASLHMDGNAQSWLQVYKLQGGLGSWEQFIQAVETKFGANDYRQALGDLLELNQADSVEEYITQFEALQYQLSIHNMGLDEMFFVTQFMRGLNPEISVAVQAHVPETMDRAVLLAKIQHQLLGKGKSKTHKSMSQAKHQGQFVKGDSKGVSTQPSLWKESQIRNYRRDHNLCFYCGEAYSPTHAAECAKRPKAQSNALVLNVLDMPLSEEVLAQLAIEDELSAEFCQLSLNALSVKEDGDAMRVRALVKGQVMLTLIDSGSSHSFISETFVQKLGLTPLPTTPQQVRVANGEIMISDKCIPNLSWLCNGATLSSDMRVLNLRAYDAILGYDWLKSHSPMQCHWGERLLEFESQGRRIKLQGLKPGISAVQALSAQKLVKWYKGNDIWALVMLTQTDLTETPKTTPEIQALLDKYQDVFADPKVLPPSRTYDHTIPLLPGAVRVNSRPYRYSPQHKDEIERQVREML